ncbi:hypothetical protein GCM10023096_60300 [Nonomuraea ferruginea]
MGGRARRRNRRPTQPRPVDALIPGLAAMGAAAAGFDEAPTPSQIGFMLLSGGMTSWIAWRGARWRHDDKSSPKRGVALKSPNKLSCASLPESRRLTALAA